MGKSNKVVQIPIDEELLAELDQLSRARRSSRSAVIRLACRDYIRQAREDALDEAYEQGYRRMPETAAVGEAQIALVGQVLAEETW